MESSKITVIIPVYNAEKYIDRCLFSICNQMYSNLEIIIINDGSKDSSYDICKKYSEVDSRIKLISQKNQGVSVARKNGILVSTGDYITFVDSDDYLAEDMYQNMMLVNKEGNIDIIESGYIFIDEKDRVLNKIILKDETIIGKEKILEKYLSSNNSLYFLWNKLYRRELFKNMSFSEFSFSEDYLWNIFLHSNCTKKIITQYAGYFYMKNMNGACNSFYNLKKIDGILAGREARSYLESNYKKFVKYAVKYTIQYELFIYSIFSLDKIKKKEFLEKIVNFFEEDYELYKKYKINKICSKSNRVAIELFKFSPTIYLIINSIYLRLKNINNSFTE